MEDVGWRPPSLLSLFPPPFPEPFISGFHGKLRYQLTIFLDFILTKYFLKRGVNEC